MSKVTYIRNFKVNSDVLFGQQIDMFVKNEKYVHNSCKQRQLQKYMSKGALKYGMPETV